MHENRKCIRLTTGSMWKGASPFLQSSILSKALLAETDSERASRAEMCFLESQLKHHKAEHSLVSLKLIVNHDIPGKEAYQNLLHLCFTSNIVCFLWLSYEIRFVRLQGVGFRVVSMCILLIRILKSIFVKKKKKKEKKSILVL